MKNNHSPNKNPTIIKPAVTRRLAAAQPKPLSEPKIRESNKKKRERDTNTQNLRNRKKHKTRK